MKKSLIICSLLCLFTSCAQLGLGTSAHNGWVRIDALLSFEFNGEDLSKEKIEELKDMADIIYKNDKCLDLDEKEIDKDICISINRIASNFISFRNDLNAIYKKRNELNMDSGLSTNEIRKRKMIALNDYELSLKNFFKQYELPKLLLTSDKYLPVTISEFNEHLWINKIAKIKEDLSEEIAKDKQSEEGDAKLSLKCAPFAKKMIELHQRCDKAYFKINNSRDNSEQRKSEAEFAKCDAEYRFVGFDTKFQECPHSLIGR